MTPAASGNPASIKGTRQRLITRREQCANYTQVNFPAQTISRFFSLATPTPAGWQEEMDLGFYLSRSMPKHATSHYP
jgi:hypothetical protein